MSTTFYRRRLQDYNNRAQDLDNINNMGTTFYRRRLQDYNNRAQDFDNINNMRTIALGNRIEKIINFLFQSKGYTWKQIAELCSVNERTAKRWVNLGKDGLRNDGIRRDNLLCIAVMRGLSADDFNNKLCKYFGFVQLYARFPSEVVWIDILNNHRWDGKERILELHNRELEQFNSQPYEPDFCYNSNDSNKTRFVNRIIGLSENTNSFSTITSQIISSGYLDSGFEKLSQLLSQYGIVEDDIKDITTKLKNSFSATANTRNMRELDAVRLKLIAIGLYKNISANGIDELLLEAHLNVLYALNPVEAIIISTLEELYTHTPSSFSDCEEYTLQDYISISDIVVKNLKTFPKVFKFNKEQQESAEKYIDAILSWKNAEYERILKTIIS